MNKIMMAAGAASLMTLGACSQYGLDDPFGQPGYQQPAGNYDAAQYYRQGDQYRDRRLGRNDEVYRGQDGRYYCRREDGTTGLIVGGLAGGVLGNIIAPGGSKLLGTIIGGAAGAVVGDQVDKGEVVCR